jgi:hypothetical protein
VPPTNTPTNTPVPPTSTPVPPTSTPTIVPTITGDIAFDNTEVPLCLYDPSIIRVSGKVSLQPVDQEARLQISWQVVHPQDLRTDLVFENYGLVQDGNQFSVDVEWPGIRPDDTVVELHVNALLLDATTREPLMSEAVTVVYYWYDWYCLPPTPLPATETPTIVPPTSTQTSTPTETNTPTNTPTTTNTNTPTPTSTPDLSREPDFAVCPANMEEIGTFDNYVRRDKEPRSHTYDLSLSEDARLTVLGYAEEGHPDACPDGRICGQGQMHEEFRVSINNATIGVHHDHGDVDTWIPVGPWQTSSVVSADDDVVMEVSHLLGGKTAESVSFKLTVCAEPVTPGDDPTPTPTVTVQKKVSPVLECVVSKNDGTYTAYFGYYNPNDITVEIEHGKHNRFTPRPQERDQPEVFQPGRKRAVFSVPFNGNHLVWTLNGKTSTASRDSQRCR